MKKSTTTIYLSTLLLTLLCFGCLPDNQQSKYRPQEEVLKDIENQDPSLDYNSQGISATDREFLESVEKRFDESGLILINGLGEKKGVAWQTWNTLDWQTKVSIGRSACETVEDFYAYKSLLSSYGDSTRNIGNQLAAAIVLDEGGRIYCHQAWALAWKKRNTKAREKYLDDTAEMLRKSALKLMTKPE
ncbi:MAG: hypothetical protein JGK21_15185 [Microcoleus sp. PH2017_22_RUC_O_B]|uniref:hypothetical protein n=1 Tax=unclassified Microcoleus TaxID=2642155 RepID=UPI001D982367|nr:MULTISPECIES: hypothetical protein [unclassified Microcoleus]MCC3529525.1 hypothetical protein [Microcoleus sp. PH2017_21_RUC_O_A]MCC3541686.1 hypothetical protein [Microcoleus sp. PH2017_22_RUC_O_B]